MESVTIQEFCLTSIRQKNAELLGLLKQYPAGYPICCGMGDSLESLWTWTLWCRDWTNDLAAEFFHDRGQRASGRIPDPTAAQLDEMTAAFDEAFQALAPDLNLPLAALDG